MIGEDKESDDDADDDADDDDNDDDDNDDDDDDDDDEGADTIAMSPSASFCKIKARSSADKPRTSVAIGAPPPK